MSKYLLNGNSEASRLDDQSDLENYSVESEIGHLNINSFKKVLDAGCGSGVLCRYLEGQGIHNIHGCDLSSESLKHAKENTRNKSTQYFKHNISESPTKEKYDLIFNRFVAHHLGPKEFEKVAKNFYNSLDISGKIVIIDLDGYFCNLIGFSKTLDIRIKKLLNAFHGDLNMGRKIPNILTKSGFEDVSWEVKAMDFQGLEKEREIEQVRLRFENSMEFYINIFGTEFEAKKFKQEVLETMKLPDTPVFYNKFVITGIKK